MGHQIGHIPRKVAEKLAKYVVSTQLASLCKSY